MLSLWWWWGRGQEGINLHDVVAMMLSSCRVLARKVEVVAKIRDEHGSGTAVTHVVASS